jgi:hypothetical protein
LRLGVSLIGGRIMVPNLVHRGLVPWLVGRHTCLAVQTFRICSRVDLSKLDKGMRIAMVGVIYDINESAIYSSRNMKKGQTKRQDQCHGSVKGGV